MPNLSRDHLGLAHTLLNARGEMSYWKAHPREEAKELKSEGCGAHATTGQEGLIVTWTLATVSRCHCQEGGNWNWAVWGRQCNQYLPLRRPHTAELRAMQRDAAMLVWIDNRHPLCRTRMYSEGSQPLLVCRFHCVSIVCGGVSRSIAALRNPSVQRLQPAASRGRQLETRAHLP